MDSPAVLSNPELTRHIDGVLATTSRLIRTIIELCVRVTLLVLFLGRLVMLVGIDGNRGMTFDAHLTPLWLNTLLYDFAANEASMSAGSQAQTCRDGHNSTSHVETTTSSIPRSSRPHVRSTVVSVRERPGELVAPKNKQAAPGENRERLVTTSNQSAAVFVPNEGVRADEPPSLVNGDEFRVAGTPISVSSESTKLSIPGSPITVHTDSDADTSNTASDANEENLAWDAFDDDARSQVGAELIRYPEDFPADLDYYNTVSGYPIEEIDRRMLALMDVFKDHTITIDSRGYYLYPRFELSPPSRSAKWFVVTWGWRIGVYDNR